jgi:acetoin utilization protein AcuC
VAVVVSERLARYGFGDGHPFGTDRHAVFVREFEARGLDKRVRILEPRVATEEELHSFHTPAYVDFVRERSASGQGLLDGGDTPAFRGVYEAAACVVGATLNAADAIMQGECRRAFVPIAGLHHAARDRAAGFCVFNDCGVAIELLRKKSGLDRVAYVDIDAHHGDGVFYAPLSYSRTCMRMGVTYIPAPALRMKRDVALRRERSSICRWRRAPTMPLSRGCGPR